MTGSASVLGGLVSTNSVNAAVRGDWEGAKDATIQGNRTLNVLNNLKNTDGGIGLLNVANAGFYGYDVQQDGLASANGMSSSGGAFDAHVRLGTVDTEQTWTESYLSQFNAGGNVRIGSDKDVNLLGGTQINAGKDIILSAGRDLNIAANSDTYKFRDSSTGVTVGYNGSWYVGADHSRSKSDSTTYTNANLQAGGNIVTQSGRDTNIAGANLVAGKLLAMDVGRALNVTTLQNSTQSESYGGSIQVGANRSVGASANAANGDRTFADNQTTLIGREGVAIRVKGETTMVGSMIANIDENGVDQGNLILQTAKLNYVDLANNDDSRSAGVSVGLAGEDGVRPDGTKAPEDSYSKHRGTVAIGTQDVDGVTRATVGAGAIIVGSGDLIELNRDVTKANEITKSDSSKGEVTAPIPNQVAEPVRDGMYMVATTGGKTVYYVSPVYASRVINENNDQTGKPENPAPHFVPGLGLTKSETGRDPEIDVVTNQEIPVGFLESFTVGTNQNPILKGMYHTIPGFPSNTGFHDAAMEGMVNPSDFVKAVSIPPYFAYNYYGAVGTLMDVPNYNTNFTEIRNTVIHGNANGSQNK
jgi:hypothetical protein